MAYSGVQFSEADGGTISLVNTGWLTPRKKEVYWPSHYTLQHLFDKALQKELVPSEDWDLFKIEKIFFSCDDLAKAHKKLLQAEVTSDIQSEDDLLNCGGKRRTVKPVRLRDSNSSLSDDSDKLSKSNKKAPSARPPRINIQNPQRKETDLQEPAFRQSLVIKSNFGKVHNKKSSSLTSCLDLPTYSKNNETDCSDDSDKLNESYKEPLPKPPIKIIKKKTQESCLREQTLSQNFSTPKVDTILRPGLESNKSQLDTVISYLACIKLQNEQILAAINKGSRFPGQRGLPPDNLPVELPIKSYI